MKTQVIEHEWSVTDEAGTETNNIQAIRRPSWEWVETDGKKNTFNIEPFEVGDSRSNTISINSVEEAIAYISILTDIANVLAVERITEEAAKKEAE